MPVSLLFVVLSSFVVSARPRTLVETKCPRLLMEFAAEAEDSKASWAPMPRVIDAELELINAVKNDAAEIEAFARSLFPGLSEKRPDRMTSFFRWMWHRLPEYTYVPAKFSKVPKKIEIVREWQRLAEAFNQAPRRNIGAGVVQPDGPRSLRIFLDEQVRERIAKLDPELRRTIETTPFEPRAILNTLMLWTDEEDFIEEGGARLAFRRMWRRTLGIEQIPGFDVVEPLDGVYPNAKPAQLGMMGARIVEDFRLYKMLYNRNRPSAGSPAR